MMNAIDIAPQQHIWGTDRERALVAYAWSLLGPEISALLQRDGVTYRFLGAGEQFADVARSYRSADTLVFGVCEGLYDPGERRIVLASTNLHTIVHETLHHGDHALSGYRGYRSGHDDRIARAYRRHVNDGLTISAYATVNPTEFMAESWRSLYVSRPSSRRADLERLERIDPTLVSLMRDWTKELIALGKTAP